MLPDVKIIGAKTGWGNCLQMVHVINEFKKQGRKVYTDAPGLYELGIAEYKKGYCEENIFVYGYNWKSVLKERLKALFYLNASFTGYKYKIKKWMVGVGLNKKLDYDKRFSEKQNNWTNYPSEKIDYNIHCWKPIKKRVVLCNSEKDHKHWNKWSALAYRLRENNYEVKYISGNDLSLTKKDIKDIISTASYVITPDCAFAHLADVIGVPTVVMASALDWKKWELWNKCIMLTPEIDCAPCKVTGQPKCNYNYKCMDYSVDEVYETFIRLTKAA